MTEKVVRRAIDGGSAKYWQEQREGFPKINRIHDVFVAVEQDGGYHRIDEVTSMGASHPGVVRILEAHGLRVNRPYWNSYPVILNKKGLYARSWDIPEFGRKRNQ